MKRILMAAVTASFVFSANAADLKKVKNSYQRVLVSVVMVKTSINLWLLSTQN